MGLSKCSERNSPACARDVRRPACWSRFTVSAYGSDMPLNQVAALSVPEPRMISVQVWDKGMVAAVEKAIRTADLGLNPAVDGTLDPGSPAGAE